MPFANVLDDDDNIPRFNFFTPRRLKASKALPAHGQVDLCP